MSDANPLHPLEKSKPQASPPENSDSSSNDVQPEPDLKSQLPVTSQSQAEDRSELITRARSFLISPQIQHQDLAEKRAFLAEKGLNGTEIESLLRHLLPTIPPRTYPQLPPSNLPVLPLGLARLFSWLAGGSAFLVLIYHRLLLPRISQTSLARHSLKSHHVSLLRQLTTSLSALKESQSESFSVLPRLDPFKEPKPYSECKSLADIIEIFEKTKEPDFSQLPTITALRCGIKDLIKRKEGGNANPATEDLFRYLESQIPWLLSEDGLRFENQLWETLSTCPVFRIVASSNVQETVPSSPSRWEYIPQEPTGPPPLLKSLQALSLGLPKDVSTRKSPFQHTLQSLSDFTGYISTQIYLPYRPPPGGMGLPSNSGQNTLEEELRKEIRALKGLVLNRRSFMPTRGGQQQQQPSQENR